MRVEFHTENGVVGTVDVLDGLAVGSNAIAQRMIDTTKVVWPGSPPTLVRPDEGERYLRALPANFSGSRFWAELVP